jgi:vacuolar protein sorting-associated protein 13A/C
MFESQVAYYLNRYLGRYLQGLDAESLRISVWKGDVELRNLALKPDALEDLDLPVAVKAGLLGKLTLKVRGAHYTTAWVTGTQAYQGSMAGHASVPQVPWKALGREPVVVEFDRLYILACPKEAQAQGPCQVMSCVEGAQDSVTSLRTLDLAAPPE